MNWQQNYDPCGNALLSTLLAALPVVVLLGAIAWLEIRIHLAALLGLVVALGVALFGFHMPLEAALATAGYGAAFGLFPIGWIILNLIFLYQLTVERGLFAVLRGNLATIAPDPRVQVILIAFSFGAFVEYLPGREGLCHVSELASFRVKRTEDIVRVGDDIWVKYLGLDEKGRVRLSRKAAMEEREKETSGETAAPPATAAPTEQA